MLGWLRPDGLKKGVGFEFGWDGVRVTQPLFEITERRPKVGRPYAHQQIFLNSPLLVFKGRDVDCNVDVSLHTASPT